MPEVNKIIDVILNPTFTGPKVNEIIDFILNPTFTGWLLVLKIFFIVLSSILIGFIIWALVKTTWLKRLIIWDLQEFLTYRPFGLRKIEKEWRKIKGRLEREGEAEWKLAIIEADEIMDNILERMGFSGGSLDERLRGLTTASLPNIEEVKEAHKIRNNIIHDPSYRLTLEEVKRVITIYEKALTDLHVL